MRALLPSSSACTAATPAMALDRRELRVGVETASPPFSAIDEFGGFRGFNVDVTRALCEQMQVSCTLVATNLGDAIPHLQNRAVDLVVAMMSITAERKRLIDFTDPYFHSGNRAIGPRGMPDDLSPEASGARRSASIGARPMTPMLRPPMAALRPSGAMLTGTSCSSTSHSVG